MRLFFTAVGSTATTCAALPSPNVGGGVSWTPAGATAGHTIATTSRRRSRIRGHSSLRDLDEWNARNRRRRLGGDARVLDRMQLVDQNRRARDALRRADHASRAVAQLVRARPGAVERERDVLVEHHGGGCPERDRHARGDVQYFTVSRTEVVPPRPGLVEHLDADVAR